MVDKKSDNETKVRVISKNRRPVKYNFPQKKDEYDNSKEIKDVLYGVGMVVVGVIITIVNISNPDVFSSSKAIVFRVLPFVGIVGIIVGIGLVIISCVKMSENNEKKKK